jgi:1-phosphofructokinase
MNPAVDKTIVISDFRLNHVNRIESIQLDAAGKGINVSKSIKKLGGRTKTFAFLGGENGKYIEDTLEAERISIIPVYVPHNTRVNTKVVDYKNQTFTDINEPGGHVGDVALNKFKSILRQYVTSQSVVVFTGSVPKGVPSTIYKELIENYNAIGAITVLDADGDLLSEGIKACPKVVKPNIHELEKYLRRSLNTDEDIIHAGKDLVKAGIEIVVISLGEKGAVLITEDLVYKAEGLEVDVKSTVGAGDSMLAGLCYGLNKNIPLEKTMALAIATSAANVMTEGSQPAEFDMIQKLVKKVIIKKIGE